MNHLIKITSPLLCSAVLFALAGCGDSGAEKAAKEKERQRLEMEQQAMRDVQKANKAITENNKKLGRKPPTMDLGLPAEKKTEEGASAPPKK